MQRFKYHIFLLAIFKYAKQAGLYFEPYKKMKIIRWDFPKKNFQKSRKRYFRSLVYSVMQSRLLRSPITLRLTFRLTRAKKQGVKNRGVLDVPFPKILVKGSMSLLKIERGMPKFKSFLETFLGGPVLYPLSSPRGILVSMLFSRICFAVLAIVCY